MRDDWLAEPAPAARRPHTMIQGRRHLLLIGVSQHDGVRLPGRRREWIVEHDARERRQA